VATIRDIMTSTLVTVDRDTTVAQAATVMAEKRVGSALVLDGDSLVGIFTERDIVRALSQDFDAPGHPISHWMTADPMTITPESSPEDALDTMLSRGFRHLPVLDGGKVLGVVSIRDLSAAKSGEEHGA
jgi:CBS domain-containing protein